MSDNAADLRVLVTLLRRLRAPLSQAEMASKAGINPGTVSLYESGALEPSRTALEKLAAVPGVPLWAVDGLLLPAIAMSRDVALSETSTMAGDPDLFERSAEEATSPEVRLAMARFLAIPADESAGDSATAVSRSQATTAEDPWAHLPVSADATSADALELRADFERLLERICAESTRAAANDPRRALELARLALRLADLPPGETPWRATLLGYALAFFGNALRVGDDLHAADAAFAGAWQAWRLGKQDPASLLGEWRLLDLEASLRRAQRRFGAALDLLDRALAAAPAAARGHTLLSKAYTLEQAGRFEAAITSLLEATPLLDASGEPRDRVAVRFNVSVNLCHLGRFDEAEAALPALRQLVLGLGGDHDQTRFRWLASRVALGRGRREEGLAGLAAVQRDFRERGRAYDAALVSLEIGILYLEEGRTAEVAVLASQMAWIFKARDVRREALAALRLYCDAARRQTLTLAHARQLRDDLDRARHDRGGLAVRSGPHQPHRQPRCPSSRQR